MSNMVVTGRITSRIHQSEGLHNKIRCLSDTAGVCPHLLPPNHDGVNELRAHKGP